MKRKTSKLRHPLQDPTADNKRVKSDEDKKSKAPVDPLCHDKLDKAHVYFDENSIYDVMLNQTNLHANNNKFYKIQLLEDDNVEKYSVWFRWGRVGKDGQMKLEHCGSLLEAKEIFEKKFRDKTCNDWEDREDFEKYGGKYDLVEIDYGVDKMEAGDTKVNVKLPPSKLDKAIQDLLELISDIKKFELDMATLKYDMKRTPLGKLTKKQIANGYSIIKQMSDLVTNIENSKRNACNSRRASMKISRSIPTLRAELSELCSLFYTKIPHDFGMRTPPSITTPAEVKEKLELMEALANIDIAVTMMKKKKKSENPCDTYYRQLDCSLKLLDTGDPMYEILEDYLYSTRGPTHFQRFSLMDIFECRKENEEGGFNDVGNKMLLWHGSRLTNWMGILGKGLRIAPSEAPSTGYMFGKGIYFADCSTKSAGYLFPTRNSDIGLLLLCEVALGKSLDLLQSNYSLPKYLNRDCQSARGLGRMIPDPECAVKINGDVKVPKGTLIDSDVTGGSLQYNEYIVYNTNQVKLRYLLKLKFNFDY